MAAASPPACPPQVSSLALRRSGRRRPRSSMARRMRSPTAQCLTTKGETLPRLSCRRCTVPFECSSAHHMQLHKGPLVIKLDHASSFLHHASSYFHLSSYHLITLRLSSSLQSARSAHHTAHLTPHTTYHPPDHHTTTPHHTPHSPHHHTLTIHRRQPTSHANSPSAPPPL